MPKTHELKTWPEYFTAVRLGIKSFEIRKDDRNYQVGDILILQEYCPDTKQYTGETKRYRVTYRLWAEPFVPPGYVAMGIEPAEDKCQSCRERKLANAVLARLTENGSLLCPHSDLGLPNPLGNSDGCCEDCIACWEYAKEQWEKESDSLSF